MTSGKDGLGTVFVSFDGSLVRERRDGVGDGVGDVVRRFVLCGQCACQGADGLSC